MWATRRLGVEVGGVVVLRAIGQWGRGVEGEPMLAPTTSRWMSAAESAAATTKMQGWSSSMNRMRSSVSRHRSSRQRSNRRRHRSSRHGSSRHRSSRHRPFLLVAVVVGCRGCSSHFTMERWEQPCFWCGFPALEAWRCPCREASYCDVICQRRHWTCHRWVCDYYNTKQLLLHMLPPFLHCRVLSFIDFRKSQVA